MTMTALASAIARKRGAWMALALAPLLSGCLAAVAIPLVAGGGLAKMTSHRVRAATPAAESERGAARHRKNTSRQRVPRDEQPQAVLTQLKELPPPDAPAAAAADSGWASFFAYALAQRPVDDQAKTLRSAILKPNSSIELPERRACSTPYPAVVIDLDGVSAPFAPDKLTAAPAGVAEGLARLRAQGIVVLWISQLPASRAGDVARALKAAGLDPQAQDQLLMIRSSDDRKQVLRDNASDDVCIVAIAGDKRGDFDELFDYLRSPDAAAGLDSMIGQGWFLVPPLEGTPAGEK
jgi:hypothetical protein